MDLKQLRQKYEDTFGKKPFMGWGETELFKALGITPEETPVPPVQPITDQESRIKALEDALARRDAENSTLRQETRKLQEGWAEYKSPVGENKTATVKIYRKNAESPAGVIVKVIVFKNNEFNEETRKYDKLVYTVTLRYDDGTTEDIKIDAMELSKIREIEKVEIIKENSRTLRKVQEYVPYAEKDREGYPKRILSGGSGYGTSVGTGKVPLEVFMVKSDVTVRRNNGQEFEMSADFLNL